MFEMEIDRFRRRRRLAACGTLSTLFLFGVGARAEEPDDTTSEAEAQPASRETEKAPAPTAASSVAVAAPEASTVVLDHMGPETFPGRLRGLYGGSLWLEPDFQGLQWPQNTRTDLGLSAQFWVDTGEEKIRRDAPLIPSSQMRFQQGRALLRLTPAYVSGRLFAQAQVELVGNLCQAANSVCQNTGTFTTDDLFIRVGAWNLWDLKVGRFEGWEVYHLGMGMDQYTLERFGAGIFGLDTMTNPRLDAPSLYGVTYLHDRPSEGWGVGYAALHFFPTDYLRFEFLAKLGTDNYRADNSTGDTSWTYIGGRPTIIFDVGWFKLRLGAEYQHRTGISETVVPGMPMRKTDPVAERFFKGAGGSVQFVIDPILEFGLNAAIGKQEDTNAFFMPVPENSFTTKSVGGFANARLANGWLTGVGVNWTTQTDNFLTPGSTANDFTAHLQTFAALQYRPVGQFYVKAVFGFARADFLPSDPAVAEWQNYMYSLRVRLLYIY